ncbi:hypothetical protein, partial [Flavobacterium sp.]|uniref:hypothetical protein n=1 Tax=Flavobacterium sp. TaxID=239 RepID=UPI0025BC2B8D
MKNTILVVILFLSISLSAQDWQWAKRGGSTDNITESFTVLKEQVVSMVTDSDNNVYILAPVGKNNLNIDGVPKTNYGNLNTVDYMIASFSCTGDYRWSKVIGGGGNDNDLMRNLVVDTDDNVYAVGFVKPAFTASTAVHFDDDVVLPTSSSTTNTFKKSLFMIKYNKEGVFQWLRMPQADNLSFTTANQTGCGNIVIDANNNLTWLVAIPAGNYADGNYSTSGSGVNTHILKYNSNGEFLSGSPFNAVFGAGTFYSMKLYSHPTNGTLYIVGEKAPDYTVTVGSQSVTGNAYVAAFSPTGTFLWLKQSSGQNIDLITSAIDAVGNIYFAGETFNNMSFEGIVLTSPDTSSFPYLFKISSEGEPLWASTASFSGALGNTLKGLVANGNEVLGTGGAFQLTWGNFSVTSPLGTGFDTYVATFNATTGVPTSLIELTSNVGCEDFGTAATVDSNGSYYIGGYFTCGLTIGSTTLQNTGQSDFFVAKYGTTDCSLSLAEQEASNLVAFPNPTKGLVQFSNSA